MKVCLYFEGEKMIATSGIGRALKHQIAALNTQGIETTTDPDDDYDILHINTVYVGSENVIKHARSRNIPVVYHAHSTEEDFKNSFILSNQLAPLFKQRLVSLYSSADEIITPTPYSKKLLEGYGITVPITAISNGVDLEKFKPDQEKIKAFRDYFSLKEEDKVILSVGLFFKRKGILDFVEVARRCPQYKFIWFGHTPSLSIPKEVRDVTVNYPANVIFPGYVSGPIIQGAYAGADVFFFPSYEETEGIVVLEALASYQNVLIRDIGAFDPWMIHGVNCYKGKSIDDFVSMLENIIEKRCPETKMEGRKTAEERSFEKIGEQLKEVYERVLSNR